MSNPQTRIAGALLVAAVLISGSLFVRSWSTTNLEPIDQQNVAVITAAPERIAINVADKNNDGVPDWQEALLITEALTIADTDVIYDEPDTLTEQFALEFFEEMVRNENYGAFGDTPEELIDLTSDALARQATDVFLSETDIIISSDTSVEALSKYGEAVADIIYAYPGNNTENEAKVLERALRNQDANELIKLDKNITTYTNIFKDTKILAVPQTVVGQHLDLLNTYQALISDIAAMRNAFDDPMYALLRLKRYQEDASGLYTSIINLYTVLQNAGAQWGNSSSVQPFIIGINSINQ